MSGPDIAWIDTLDICHLQCPTCIRGVRGLENSSRTMPLQQFALIAGRLKEQGFRRIGLYNWTEPFLNRTIDEYVAAAKAAHLWVTLSSTLSLYRIPKLEATILAGLDHLTVSVSGFDQETYQINHVGGVLKYVTANLHWLRDIISLHHLNTHVDLRMLKFDYNAHQEPLLRAFAESLGLHFELLEATGDPKCGSPEVRTNEQFIREGELAATRRSPEDEGKACELMFNQLAIDCSGDAYLCCAMPNYPTFRLGRFLDMTPGQILRKKFAHPVCRSCTMPRRDWSESEETRLAAALGSGRNNLLTMRPA